MAGRVIVVTSGKGGVGKTTTVANIGTGLALQQKKVVMIDTDIGLRNLDVVMGMESGIIYDVVDLAEGECRSTRQSLVRNRTPEQMREIVDELKEEFDYVLIDCPAGIERGFDNAVAAASEAIVVTIPEVPAVRDADRIIGLWLNAKEKDKEKKEPVLVLNRLRPDMVRKEEMLGVDDINHTLAIKLLGIIPEDEEIIIATNKGEPVILNQHSRAGEAFKNIVRRLEGETVPFMSFDTGIIGRFWNMLHGK